MMRRCTHSAAGCKVDDVAILALLAHLPRQQATGQQRPACLAGPQIVLH